MQQLDKWIIFILLIMSKSISANNKGSAFMNVIFLTLEYKQEYNNLQSDNTLGWALSLLDELRAPFSASEIVLNNFTFVGLRNGTIIADIKLDFDLQSEMTVTSLIDILNNTFITHFGSNVTITNITITQFPTSGGTTQPTNSILPNGSSNSIDTASTLDDKSTTGTITDTSTPQITNLISTAGNSEFSIITSKINTTLASATSAETNSNTTPLINTSPTEKTALTLIDTPTITQTSITTISSTNTSSSFTTTITLPNTTTMINPTTKITAPNTTTMINPNTTITVPNTTTMINPTTTSTAPNTTTTPTTTITQTMTTTTSTTNFLPTETTKPGDNVYVVQMKCKFLNDPFDLAYNDKTSQKYINYTNKITIKMREFLFNFSLRLLYIIFTSLSEGSVIVDMELIMASSTAINRNALNTSIRNAAVSAYGTSIIIIIPETPKEGIPVYASLLISVASAIFIIAAVLIVIEIYRRRSANNSEPNDDSDEENIEMENTHIKKLWNNNKSWA